MKVKSKIRGDAPPQYFNLSLLEGVRSAGRCGGTEAPQKGQELVLVYTLFTSSTPFIPLWALGSGPF